VYDRDLHDRLLNEVIAADPVAQDLTLSNILAQQQARELLGNAGEYF
jgi:TRAP transporter T-component